MITHNVCLWGDSITYGAFNEGGGWADRLKDYLHDVTVRTKFENYFFVYNLGIPGDTTEDLLPRFDAECAAREPHISVIAVGINDSQHTGEPDTHRVPRDTFRANIGTLIAKAKAASDMVIVLGLTDVDEGSTTPFEAHRNNHYTRKDVAEYDAIIQEEVKKAAVHFIPMQSLLSESDLRDGLHPNASGHQKMFERVRDFLKAQNIV